jgi:septal ring factor EnvC (AmiA/AmiB activator)
MRVALMWLSEHDSLRRQIKRLESELKTLRKARQEIQATGCYSDRELAAKEAALEDYDRRIQILDLERDRLRLMYQTGGSHDVQAES